MMKNNKNLSTQKRKKFWIILLIIITFSFLWFSDVLPKQIAEVVATNYMLKQENGNNYEVYDVEYSNAHDCYFVYFQNKDTQISEMRNIGIYYRYLPFYVYCDSNYPG